MGVWTKDQRHLSGKNAPVGDTTANSVIHNRFWLVHAIPAPSSFDSEALVDAVARCYNRAMHICFFDIDGTLILTDGAGQEAFEKTFAEEFGVQRWKGNVEFSGRSDRAIVGDLFEQHGLDNTRETWERFAAGYVKRLPRSLAERNGCVLPGIEELLKMLDARADVAIGLLTGNMRSGAVGKLRHFGLADYFPFGGFGDAHADRDKIAATALYIAKEYVAGVNHDNTVSSVLVIGDTPHDVRCARSIGAMAVGVATGFSPKEDLVASAPDLLVDDLLDPSPLLELLPPCQS